MRKPELNRDYALIQVYKCWHCDHYDSIGSKMSDHVVEKHSETLGE